MSDEPSDPTDDDLEPGDRQVAERAELLPEERTVGSDDPQTQAEIILEESRDRTENPDPDASRQSGRRTSADTV
ncbi:MAG TPA: hypothetical protein VF661_03335 [Actinomycetales bacterium]|jgi:hypothetical protein